MIKFQFPRRHRLVERRQDERIERRSGPRQARRRHASRLPDSVLTKFIMIALSCHQFVNASLTVCRDAEHSLASTANSSRIVLRSRARTLYTLEQASNREQFLSTIYCISR